MGVTVPVYDYKCSCGNTRTQTISINEKDFKAVCHCGKEMVRDYKTVAVAFKGTGFYQTDKNR